MLRYDEPTHHVGRPEIDSRKIEKLENKVGPRMLKEICQPNRLQTIYAFIVEVVQAANCSIEREVPVIALCDAESSTNWVSSGFLEDLERSASHTSTALIFSNFRKPRHRKESEAPRITIRWTCGKLGQNSAEGIFVVEPKAQFKILFGCGYPFDLAPRQTASISNFPPRFTSRKENTIQGEQSFSESVAEGFRQGIEDGTLLRLRRMPPVSQKSTSFVSIETLEVELHHLTTSSSTIDSALSSDSAYDDTSSCLTGGLPNDPNFLYGTETDDSRYSYPYAESINTSISDGPYRHTSRRREEGSPSSLEIWYNQEACEDPLPLVSRMIQPRRARFPLKRCNTPSPEEQQALDEARAAAERAAREYWIWDKEANNYKHYDEGNSEPVWYNPP